MNKPEHGSDDERDAFNCQDGQCWSARWLAKLCPIEYRYDRKDSVWPGGD